MQRQQMVPKNFHYGSLSDHVSVMKQNFLSQFYLFGGLQKLITIEKYQNDNDIIQNLSLGELKCRRKESFVKPIEDILVENYKCDPSWPVCLYDFSFKTVFPRYFAFRVGKPPLIIEDYFSSEYES